MLEKEFLEMILGDNGDATERRSNVGRSMTREYPLDKTDKGNFKGTLRSHTLRMLHPKCTASILLSSLVLPSL